MTAESVVSMEVEGGVALVMIRREKALNALSGQVLAELFDAACRIEADREVRVVILTGAGDKAFVAGADIAEMREMDVIRAGEFSSQAATLSRDIETSRVPWIAAVNGYALGGGCELALACDFIYASDRARFGQPEVKLGVIPGFGGTQRLARRVGLGKARELVLTGEMIDAAEALRIGLCDQVVPGAELMDRVRKVAGAIARNGPLAVAEAKRVMHEGQSMPLDGALALETRAFAALFATRDQREGMAAFLDKRPADFKGE